MKTRKENLNGLMIKSLNRNYSSRERAEVFDKIYYDYIKENGSDKGWDEFRDKLRKKHERFLTFKEKKKFGLNKIQNKELKKFVVKSLKSRFPVEIFYATAWQLIKRLAKKGDKILDIGFGDYPVFLEFLNSKGYNAYGLEPYPKKIDNKKSFKGTIKRFPKKLEQKYNIILINMVYSINYTNHFWNKFKWELKNKLKILNKLSLLVDSKGYLILIDDLGTIFTKKMLEKYFKVLLYEKYCNGKITLLQK